MARALSLEMNAAALEPHLRMPRWKLLVYDILSGGDAMSDIVLGNELDDLTGPRDFTSELVGGTVNDVGGDYVESGVAASSVTFDILDPTGRFDPSNYQLTGVGDGRWLREGNVVQVIQGDARVDEDDWVVRFTGYIVGQAGVDRSRTTMRGLTTCKALGRESKFANQDITTDKYPAGTTYATIMADIAESDMGLLVGEYSFGSIGTTVARLKVNQFPGQSPLVSIAKLMFLDLYMPRFNGEGKLIATSGSISQASTRIYVDKSLLVSMVRPYHESQRVNAVQVKGIGSGLVKAEAPTQELAIVEVTTGYFARKERLKAYWSKDHTQLADGAYMRILQSVNGGISSLGGDEDYELIPAPNPDEEGSIGAEITIDTGFAPYLLVLLTVDYVAAAFVPDQTIPLTEITLPVGRIFQAGYLVGILIIMTKIGRGSYQFIGTPFEYIHHEIRGEARETGVTLATRNALEVTNHLVNSTSLCHALARDLLMREVTKSNVRQAVMFSDPRVEVDDVIEFDDNRRYLVRGITTPIGRSADGTSQLDLAEVTEGIRA